MREFVVDVPSTDAPQPGEDVLSIDDPRFSVAPGSTSRTVRRTWLDTFDWRLFRAGLALELVAERGATELLLTGRDGELIAAEQARLAGRRTAVPCKADALPFGPLREHLSPVIGVRALLPVARVTSVLSQRRALNADDKTIAFVTVDKMAAGHAGGRAAERPVRIPPRIAITPLRGYQAQASKLADVIGATPGVRQASTTAFEAAMAAAGRRPGDYTSRIDVRLTEAMPAPLALATILGALLDAIGVNVAGTIGDVDTEFLHDLRVAVRRTRSVLKMAEPALPAGLLGRYRPEFKWLGDLTTPARDLDVYLLGYQAMSSQLVAASTADLLPFRDYLQAQRDLAYRHLVRGLRSARFSSLTDGWRHELDQVAAAPPRRPTVGKFAARRIARAHQRVLRRGGAIDSASPPQALHDLRKCCKELRYALEVFASLYAPAPQWRAVAELKELQNCLGEFQDTDVQLAELQSFASQMMAAKAAPAKTLLAMGEIAATLAVRQRAARGEFAERFAEFASPRGQAKIHALTGTAT